jgi:hypothetical protein
MSRNRFEASLGEQADGTTGPKSLKKDPLSIQDNNDTRYDRIIVASDENQESLAKIFEEIGRSTNLPSIITDSNDMKSLPQSVKLIHDRAEHAYERVGLGSSRKPLDEREVSVLPGESTTKPCSCHCHEVVDSLKERLDALEHQINKDIDAEQLKILDARIEKYISSIEAIIQTRIDALTKLYAEIKETIEKPH